MRDSLAMLPVVLCIDVEPDLRMPTDHPVPFLGFEVLAERLPELRERLGSILGEPPHLTWGLRMDPQIEVVYGSSAWVAETYANVLTDQVAAGDALGVHPHMWRLEDSGWWNDNADPAWVHECFAMSLDAYERTFGEPCRISRGGDRFISPAVVQQLEAAGVVVDLTVEPGLAPVAQLAADEPTRGILPDTRAAPTRAYRIARTDICGAEPHRRSALVELPLTPGVTVAVAEHLPPQRVTGSFRTLTPWTEPRRFALQLERRLRSPDLTHLAFAIRADVALLPGPWAAVVANVEHLARVVAGSGRFVTALEATEAVGPSLDAPPAAKPVAPDTSAGWALGPADPGAIERVDPAHALQEEPPDIEWLQGADTIECPACGAEHEMDRVARTIPPHGLGVEAHRCQGCRSVRISGPHVGLPLHPPHLEDTRVVSYVEHRGGLEVIAATLASAGARPAGTRLLDIGCGYGFGLALARGLWGWDGEGVDPGVAAVIGAEQLGHRLHRCHFDADLRLDHAADVILASEVIEHVPDPLALLRAVRRHLSDDGVVVLTTPDGDAVDRSRTLSEVRPALGEGGHLWLQSEGSLATLLATAGFAGIRVDRRGATLHAVATPDAARLPGADDGGPHGLHDIAAWALDRAMAAPPASALHLGLAARAARLFLHTADLEQAWRAREVLTRALATRHAVVLDTPGATMARVTAGELLPAVVADAHLTTGVLHLHADQHGLAAAHLVAAAEVAAVMAHTSLDPSLLWTEAHAVGQAASALARTAPEEVERMLLRLARLAPQVEGVVDVAAMTSRAFTDLVACGHHAEAEAVRGLVPSPSRRALAGGEARRAALDAEFMRAVLDLHLGRPTEAQRTFEACAEMARTAGDDHSRRLAADADEHARVAATQAATAARPAHPRRAWTGRRRWAR